MTDAPDDVPAVLATYAPAPRDLQCPACGFWYQDTAGHACTPC